MSEAIRSFEEWLNLYAIKHHCSIDEAKKTAMAAAIKLMCEERNNEKRRSN